jgi:DNA-binding transcriptional ArsR family regulator
MWVLHFLESAHEHEGGFANLEPLRRQLGPQIAEVRGDGLTQYSTELVVLAYRSGTLLDLDLDRFLERVDAAIASSDELPSLRSELPLEREAVRDRLARLRRDEQARARYVELLSTVWAAVRPEWEEQGRAAAVTEAERWTRTLREGAGHRDVLGLQRLWPGRPELDDLADAAARADRLVLTPCWFGGKIHIIELDGTLYAGRGIRHRERSYRKIATEISSNLKALSDPTRLAILLRLAREPASVTEIARQFHLSQPTVSAHVQVLRDAGLLDERQVGRSAELSATEEGLRKLFESTQDALLSLYRS